MKISVRYEYANRQNNKIVFFALNESNGMLLRCEKIQQNYLIINKQ